MPKILLNFICGTFQKSHLDCSYLCLLMKHTLQEIVVIVLDSLPRKVQKPNIGNNVGMMSRGIIKKLIEFHL